MNIQIEGLRKSFKQGDHRIDVLRGLGLEAKSGEVLAILGQSGSGKSTFLSLLSGLESPDQGSIKYGETIFSDLDEASTTQFRARKMGTVFQQYHLIPHLTALENVTLPLEIRGESIGERAEKLLFDVGLGHRLHHMPSELSGGECQRVAIARALVVRPELILADEPSGNLDQQTGEQVMALFFKLVRERGTTTLLVTHNQQLTQFCDRIFRLVEGKLVEETR